MQDLYKMIIMKFLILLNNNKLTYLNKLLQLNISEYVLNKMDTKLRFNLIVSVLLLNIK